MERSLLVTILAFGIAASGASAQTITERLAAGSREPGTPLLIGTLGEATPLSVEELTKQSDLAVETRVTRLKTYTNAADTAVLTDFAVLPIRVLAGTPPVDNRSPGVIHIVVSTGVTVRAENHGLQPLKPDAVYLLFLKRFGQEPGVYTIYNAGAFEVANDTLRPLAIPREVYRDWSETPYSRVAARVSEAARFR
jgi:hypothetical protein